MLPYHPRILTLQICSGFSSIGIGQHPPYEPSLRDDTTRNSRPGEGRQSTRTAAGAAQTSVRARPHDRSHVGEGAFPVSCVPSAFPHACEEPANMG